MNYLAPSSFIQGNSMPKPSQITNQQPRDVTSRFGLRLRELRQEHKLTQLRMAVDFGIDRSYISDVERGRKTISLPMLEVVALGLRMPLSDLLRGI
jgi:DNA-binding XRE family transcriptional regulator